MVIENINTHHLNLKGTLITKVGFFATMICFGAKMPTLLKHSQVTQPHINQDYHLKNKSNTQAHKVSTMRLRPALLDDVAKAH